MVYDRTAAIIAARHALAELERDPSTPPGVISCAKLAIHCVEEERPIPRWVQDTLHLHAAFRQGQDRYGKGLER
jgi:hypothetical protein